MKQTEVANSSKTIDDISISGSHHNTANGLHFFFFSLSSLKTLRSSTLFFFSFLLGLDSGEGVGRGSFSFGICHARWSETIVKKMGKRQRKRSFAWQKNERRKRFLLSYSHFVWKNCLFCFSPVSAVYDFVVCFVDLLNVLASSTE